MWKLSIVTVLVAVTVFGNRVNSSTVGRQEKLSKHPVVLVVSFDGFRYDYLDRTATPTLKAIQKEGVSVPFMQAQYPTKTFPNHQSIATGLFPAWHGITDNVVYDPLYGKNLSGFTDDPEFWNFHQDALPFWIRNEQAGDGRYSGCYMWAGSSQGFGKDGHLYPTYYIPKYDDAVSWENRVETVISWITHDTKPVNMAFLYHNEPDSRGHKSGADSEETFTEVRRVDNRTAYLVQKLKDAQIYDKINLIILSDHGMQTVPRENVIDTRSFADSSLFTRHGGSPSYHIRVHNASNLGLVYNSFKSASQDKSFSVYKKEEMGFLNYGQNRRIMDILLLADPGYCFEDYTDSSFNPVTGITGIHGYDNRSQNMTAIFIARGPLFKSGFRASKSFNNVDLFPLFSEIMSVPLSPNNGSLENVAEFLVSEGGGGKGAGVQLTHHVFNVVVMLCLSISLQLLQS